MPVAIQTPKAIAIGPISDPAVTHLMPFQTAALFDVSYQTLKTWKRDYAFPKPAAFYGGVYFYSRDEVLTWSRSRNAPAWLRGGAPKPKSVRAALAEQQVADLMMV